jgi:CheY-like chemotaxis protein
MRILIIDDDREDTDLFCEALTEIFPQAICTARNHGNDIVSFIESIPVQDVIFIDGHLNAMMGLDCLKEMRNSLSKNTRIVVHSGSLSPAEIDDFKNAGVSEFLSKVNSYHALKANLKDLLGNKFNLVRAGN